VNTTERSLHFGDAALCHICRFSINEFIINVSRSPVTRVGPTGAGPQQKKWTDHVPSGLPDKNLVFWGIFGIKKSKKTKWQPCVGMLIPGKSHSRIESRNSRVSIDTLDFDRVPTFTCVIGVGSPVMSFEMHCMSLFFGEAESILVIGCPTEPANLAPLVKFSK